MARTSARMRSRSTQFSHLPSVHVRRSLMDRSHDYKTTFNSGYLIPFYCDEVLPGDTFKLDCATFCRLNTPVVPFIDNLWLETFYFFVPNRLVWDNWQKFCGEQKNPGDSIDYLIPTLASVKPESQSIFDYFGIPSNQGTYSNINTLPLRAYNLIFNEWFRDENLQNSVIVNTGDGPDPVSNYQLLKRGKRHDYFTSALPWPQKGPAVEVGLSGNAPVVGLENGIASIGGSNTSWSLEDNRLYGYPPPGNRHLGIDFVFQNGYSHEQLLSSIRPTQKEGIYNSIQQGSGEGATESYLYQISGNGSYSLSNPVLNFKNGNQAYADLSGVNAITINDLRTAFQIQKFYERCARSGTRYTEILRGFFGVISPDARLQRPEYLGGSRDRVNVVPVAQNSSSDSTSPQGNLSAFGLASSFKRGFTKSFVEHGYIIGLVCVRADLTYQQGINRMWSRRSRFDFYWPTLAHLGEQAILNKEIYAQGNDQDDQVFGYQERYAEYRYFPSVITGKLRSTDPQTLDVWHLAQKFDNLPTLSPSFIEENPPVNRVVAVPSEPEFLLDAWFSCRVARPMPLYGVPGLVDHF